MTTPWVTIPFKFVGDGGQTVGAVQIDTDFQTIADLLNAFNPSGAPAGPGALYGMRGLTGANNTGTPTTKYDIAANAMIFRSPTDGSVSVQTAVGTLTNDITLAGPIINGRDQSGAFTVSSWIHLYAILNPVSGVTASLSSAVAPPTGPALPSGDTMWAYAGALRLDGSGHILATRMRGALMTYDSAQQVVNTNATAINTETTVSVSGVVPPNALTFLLTQGAIIMNGASCGWLLDTRVVTGDSYVTTRGVVTPTGQGAVSSQLTVPNVGQSYFYLWQVDTPSAPALDETQQWINGYRVPNGDA